MNAITSLKADSLTALNQLMTCLGLTVSFLHEENFSLFMDANFLHRVGYMFMKIFGF